MHNLKSAICSLRLVVMKHPDQSALLTDLYEITMLQTYFACGMNGTAVFEFFVRALPKTRSFLMAAGLEQAIAYLTELRFREEDVAWLERSGRFSAPFVDSLADFRFTGDVDAMPEGSVVFADEPILRVVAPLREAQFVESRLINLLHYQTLIASKAARSRIAAPDKLLVDFGLRRAHGAEAGILSARASYIAGFDGTATALAAPLFDMPIFGTMAHSFIQVHEAESDAFAAYARVFPDNAILLVDTYDTEAGARQAARLSQRLRSEENIRIKGVRIDSGDLRTEAMRVREILDAGGGEGIEIFVSGNLDEYALQALVQGGAPIDGFGVGTRINTSSDAPYLDCAYKLVEYAGEPRRKRSLGKATWPGRKQVWRRHDAHGVMCGDTLALHDDAPAGLPLLRPVMREGRLLQPLPALPDIRSYARTQIASLPPFLQTLDEPAQPYAVTVSDALQALALRVDERQRAGAAET